LLRAGSPERTRLDRRLRWIAAQLRSSGICLQWEQGAPLAGGALAVDSPPGAPARPQLRDFVEAARPERPALLLVEQLITWDAGLRQNRNRKGATPGVGANVAAVRYDDRRGDAVAIRNELLHVLGLSDAELGASESEARHTLRPVMNPFLRCACTVSAYDGRKRQVVVAKEECLARQEGDRCYAAISSLLCDTGTR